MKQHHFKNVYSDNENRLLIIKYFGQDLAMAIMVGLLGDKQKVQVQKTIII
ncbi:MAG: hypothetical protein JW917_00435 [Ignavibacteria bacterium]|nr:hypothetical protein [Ignavibacteria bacterium]